VKFSLPSFFFHKTALLVLLLLITGLISFQNIHFGVKHFWGGDYTYYNNYVVYKSSFSHLVAGKNLYDYYPQYADLFKYSPAFALLMAPFSALPDWAGLLLWNLLNVSILFFAITSLPQLNDKNRLLFILFILPELILATQNSQVNTLLAGLVILTFNMFEKNKPQYATLFIILGGFIKLFSFGTCLLLLLYPKKIKSIAYLALWSIVFTFLPLLIISPSQLFQQYENWWTLLKEDHSISTGMSVYAFTSFLFPGSASKLVTLCAGLVLLLSPLLLINKFKDPQFRISFLALLLTWMVIFNHKAESPSYIIALSGIGCWGFLLPRSLAKNIFLFLIFFFTSVWAMLYPSNAQWENLVYTKSFMPVVAFFFILFTLFRMQTGKQSGDLQQSI
jgi:hypothetical protein